MVVFPAGTLSNEIRSAVRPMLSEDVQDEKSSSVPSAVLPSAPIILPPNGGAATSEIPAAENGRVTA